MVSVNSQIRTLKHGTIFSEAMNNAQHIYIYIYIYIYITESLIDLTTAKGIAGNGCHGHVHLSVESQALVTI